MATLQLRVDDSLKNTYNYDPMYQELKRYRGNISAIDVA